MHTNEEWRDVVGFEGMYRISSTGRVLSQARLSASGHRLKERYLKPVLNSRKRKNSMYFWVRLYRQGVWKRFFVHRLVAAAFVSNPHGKPFVNHINGNKADNDSSNLEWVSEVENRRHAYANWLTPRGEASGRAILNDSQVNEIRRLATAGVSDRDIAKVFQIKSRHVHDIVAGKSWKHLLQQESEGSR